MRRAVVFIGGFRHVGTILQRDVAANLRAIEDTGVLVPSSGRRPAADELSHARLADIDSKDWDALSRELDESTRDTALLIVPGLMRLALQPRQTNRVLSRVRGLADEVVTVSAVADQLSMVNELHITRVAGWRTTDRMRRSAPDMLGYKILDLHESAKPWLTEDGLRFVALHAGDGDALDGMLRAAGIQVENPLATADPPAELGPTAVAANRLVAARLFAQAPRLQQATIPASTAAIGKARCQRLGWCTGGFWGWTPETARPAIEQFAASNSNFARAAWNTDWPTDYPIERECTEIDILDVDAITLDRALRYAANMTELGLQRIRGGL